MSSINITYSKLIFSLWDEFAFATYQGIVHYIFLFSNYFLDNHLGIYSFIWISTLNNSVELSKFSLYPDLCDQNLLQLLQSSCRVCVDICFCHQDPDFLAVPLFLNNF